jgi:NitT/TauT family transport system ATP-binding protein
MSPSQAPLGVRISDLHRAFGSGSAREVVLDGVHLECRPGELVAIIGPSGCGKTTLLRAVGGLDDVPESGVVFYAEGGAPLERAKAALSVCFQEPRLLPWLTVLDNVGLPASLAGASRADARARARRQLARVGLADDAHKRPHQLSGGMRMRAALARALLDSPRVLLLDEPFGALDELTRAALDDELHRLCAAQPLTVLLVTHSISEAVYLADRVVVLTPTPARVVCEVPIHLPARTPEVRTTLAFAEHVARVHAALERGVAEARR